MNSSASAAIRMIRIRDTRHPHTASFLGSAIAAVEYYGFSPLEAKRIERKPIPSVAHVEKSLSLVRREERSLLGAIRKCLSCARTAHEPLLVWRTTRGLARNGGLCVMLELHIIGVSSSIAEALLILVANGVAEEAGLTNRSLALNSVGTAESSTRFVRDIGAFLRKHIESISATLRPRAVQDPLGTLIQLIEKGHPAIARAPQAMEYLTEEERRRFWELLEHLEAVGLSYELNPHILGSRDFWSHTLFEMSVEDPESGARIPYAWGGRYDPIARVFSGLPVPAAVATIACEIRGKVHVKQPGAPEPVIFFAHLGMDARRKALSVLEMLRRANVPVRQALMCERIGEQMAIAARLGVPYLLIMGHKECVEGTVLLREVATNSQRAVPINEIVPTLRRHRIAA